MRMILGRFSRRLRTILASNPVLMKLRQSALVTKLHASMHSLRRWLKAAKLRRRRARVTRKKPTSRKLLYGLTASLLALLGLFFGALSYLKPQPEGRKLNISELSALATEARIETAEFRDLDSLISGTYAKPPTEAEDEATEGPSGDPSSSDKNGGKTGKSKEDKDKLGASAADADPETGGSTDDGGEAGADDETSGSEDAADPLFGGGHVAAPDGEGKYWVAYPESDALTAILVQMAAEAGATVSVEAQAAKAAIQMATTFLLPLMILANLFAVLFSASKSGGSGIGEIMMFGSIGKRRQKKGQGAPVTFDLVAGADEAVAELKEVVDYLKEPERYEDIGATPPKGVLLFGPPGCGKTLLAKAVAGEAGVPFFSVAGAEFVESLVGVGAARVRDLFASVRAVAPAIVFIDELDAAGRKRGTGGGGGGSDEREQTLNQMLVEMDGFEVSAGIVVMGATNRPDILDPALLRPGRFDRHITVDQPDAAGRQQILELHAVGKPISPTVDFSYLARRTPGFSGADLANVVNEAALLTLREDKTEIETPELEEAVQRVLAGPKKRGRLLTPEERKRVSYHESGHAIVAAAAGKLEDVHRVSILSRGRGLGVASIQGESEALLLTRSQLIAQLVTAMAGMASEELIFGEPSTGAEHDLEQASDIARDMIGRFGMGTRRRRLLGKEADSFLGDELALGQISGQTHHEMENEIDRLLEEAEDEASRLLTQHRHVLDNLSDRLENEETLEGPDLEAILALVRPEVTFLGGLAEGPLRHDEVGVKPLGSG